MSYEAVVTVDGSATWSALAAFVAEQSGVIRVAVIRCAVGPLSADTADDGSRGIVFNWLRRPDLVSVAVLSATPDAKSLTIATNCDIFLASDGTVIAAEPVVEPGLVVAIVERAGVGVAKSLLLAGRSLSALEATSLGLVDFVAPADQLETLVSDVVDRLLSTERESTTELKSLLGRSGRSGIALSADLEARDRLAAGPVVGAG